MADQFTGPMGMYEREPFSHGTAKLMETVASMTSLGCCTIIGGGDTVAASEKHVRLQYRL